MRSFNRSDRVGAHIKETLSELLLKKIKDPRLDMVTITDVEVSTDLKNAVIFFSVSANPDKVDAALEGFSSAHGYIKRTLAAELGLRYMPKIRFDYDKSFDYGAKINKLLKKAMGDSNTPDEQL